MKKICTIIMTIILICSVSVSSAPKIKSAQYTSLKLNVNGKVLNTQLVSIQNVGQYNTVLYANLYDLLNSLDYVLYDEKGTIRAEKIDNDSDSVIEKQPEKELSLTDLVAKCKDSCVLIVVKKNGQQVGTASGFAYGNGQYIITCNHVVAPGDSYRIYSDDNNQGEETTEIVARDEEHDIAILKIKTELIPVELGYSSDLLEGQKIVTITSPKGTKNVINECLYNGAAVNDGKDYLQISETAMRSGSSGGACFNLKGELIGMCARGEEEIRFFQLIPIEDIKELLTDLN